MLDDMPRPRKPYLLKETTRHGKTVWYVRRGDGPRIRIKAEFGTADFEQQYDAIMRGENPIPEAQAARKGSLKWLYERYHESAAWTRLSPATRRARENIFSHIMAVAGDKPFSAIGPKSIVGLRDDKRDTPNQARCYLDALRGLFRWAKDAKHVSCDPTRDIDNPERETGDGFIAWSDADVTRYDARWPVGTRQRVWKDVLLYIGCRRGDAVLLGKQHVKDGIISFTTEKGRKKRRIDVAFRIAPELSASLAAGPTADLAFICGDNGKPLTKESFGNMFKAACVEAGLESRSAHGLRKRSATIWAERGATENELMAMFGWLTPSMAALYTKTANRKRMAITAQDRYLGTLPEQPIPAPDKKVRG